MPLDPSSPAPQSVVDALADYSPSGAGWDGADREAERLRALERTNLLAQRDDDTFARYARLAAQIADASVSTVTLVAADSLRFVARHGLVPEGMPRAETFCDLAMRVDEQFVVEDARTDPDHAEIAELQGFDFYAATPLIVEGRHRIGSLCVYDPEARTLDEGQRAALRDLTDVLAREIDTNHLADVRADRAAAAKAASIEIEHQMRNMFAKVGAIVAMTAREHLPAEQVAQATRRRVLALSQANEVAIRHHFQPAPLAEILRAATAPASEVAGERPRLHGADLTMNSAAASVIVPLVDEVAHDSVRRGVLGRGTGVSLAWRIDGGQLVLRWEEATGARDGADAPSRGDAAKPFGSDYVRDGAPFALRGEAVVEAGEHWLSYELRMPANLVG